MCIMGHDLQLLLAALQRAEELLVAAVIYGYERWKSCIFCLGWFSGEAEGNLQNGTICRDLLIIFFSVQLRKLSG